MTIGQPVQYWAFGWRYGFIREMPTKGLRKNAYRIENPVTGLCWIPISCVNEVGDTAFHGKGDAEIFADKQEQKKEEQAKVDKMKAKARRFHRA